MSKKEAILQSLVDRQVVRATLKRVVLGNGKRVTCWVDLQGNLICTKGKEAPFWQCLSIGKGQNVENREDRPVSYPLGMLSGR